MAPGTGRGRGGNTGNGYTWEKIKEVLPEFLVSFRSVGTPYSTGSISHRAMHATLHDAN